MNTVERARISFWFPTSSHPVWQDATRTGREGHELWTYCFSDARTKAYMLRIYRSRRRLGAPPIAARVSVFDACQDMLNKTWPTAQFAEWVRELYAGKHGERRAWHGPRVQAA